MSWWVEWRDDEPIRQGDIVRRASTDGGSAGWGMIVTADCDIAQNKAGERVTWLRIVPVGDYLRDRWAPDQLRRLVAKLGRTAAEAITGAVRRRDPAVAPLDAPSLLRWLETHPPERLWAAAAPGRARDPQVVAALAALRLAAGIEAATDPLDRLARAWTAQGRNPAQQRAWVREAFDGERGFPDFFLLPDLPRGDGIGHVVLLREIASLDAGEVFATERDARLADRPDAFHRVARLHDGVRFAITQKLAFLFSRIGMPAAFEDACAAATDLAVEASGIGAQP